MYSSSFSGNTYLAIIVSIPIINDKNVIHTEIISIKEPEEKYFDL